jgi:Ca2+:H+ antiporter
MTKETSAPRSPVSFFSIVALESVLDFVGEQLALYCGKDFGDLIMITLNKYVNLRKT